MTLKVVVAGLWHLGSVTAASCSSHFSVIGLDPDQQRVERLSQGLAPIAEPGLDELLKANAAAGSLRFTTDPKEACTHADVLWICFDTPVDEDDVADVDFVLDHIREYAADLPSGAVVLISSQLPAGSCHRMETEHEGRGLSFAYSPENLRLGKALDAFQQPDRVVIGTRESSCKPTLKALFEPFCGTLLWMSPESAEMAKHAVNAFLATSITFANEIARLCEQVGADAKEVEKALKSEARIGPQAYVAPGSAIAGGTLMRDLRFLAGLGTTTGEELVLLPACLAGNEVHRSWPLRVLDNALQGVPNATIAVLGLTYKPGTDTLRRSSALELCRALADRGWTVRAFDPAIKELPNDASGLGLSSSAEEALVGADAAVCCTEWPEFREIDWDRALVSMRRALIVDPSRFLAAVIGSRSQVDYRAVGVPGATQNILS